MAITGATSGYSAGELTNLTQIEYAQEVTYGVMSTDGYQILRHAGETIAMQYVVATPEEINAASEDGATFLTSRSAGGSISGLLSYGTYDDFIAAVMGIDWIDEKSYRVSGGNRLPTLRQDGDEFEFELHEETSVFLDWLSVGIVSLENL
ncbi:MAG: phage tail tube protein [Acetobacteraceae bacterium]